MLGALATGGIWGGIIAGITASISLFQDAFQMMDEMKKKAKEVAKAWEEAKKSAVEWGKSLKKNELEKIIANGEKYIATLNKLAAAEKKVTDA